MKFLGVSSPDGADQSVRQSVSYILSQFPNSYYVRNSQTCTTITIQIYKEIMSETASTSKVNDIYQEIYRLGLTDDEKTTLYTFFTNNPDKKVETEKAFTHLQDKVKVDILRNLLPPSMFFHSRPDVSYSPIIPNTYIILCFSFLLLIVKPAQKTHNVIVAQLVAGIGSLTAGIARIKLQDKEILSCDRHVPLRNYEIDRCCKYLT
ncbi:hypothetical protein C1646_676378 [Rhizophagus diaphanus]|nr:hypothetical protein C1646_676378 [Rhizophagus diaphanus] [Rhizophagus sp. MUCL 43196]